jgi:hypothetical protein
LAVPAFRRACFLLLSLAASSAAVAEECVVLLHGLWRTENSMNRMEESLAAAGYRVQNVEYDSTDRPISELAEEAVHAGLGGCDGADTIHFVTHSMGGTGEASLPRSLGPAHFDLGIIAGNRTLNPILSRSLPGADDGKVSVDATRVEGMEDHLEMPVTHVFMMRDKDVIAQVLHYLANGRFARTADPGEAGGVTAEQP